MKTNPVFCQPKGAMNHVRGVPFGVEKNVTSKQTEKISIGKFEIVPFP